MRFGYAGSILENFSMEMNCQKTRRGRRRAGISQQQAVYGHLPEEP